MKRKGGKLEIIIKISSLEVIEQFIEKRIEPLREKYPYADIRIEVLGG